MWPLRGEGLWGRGGGIRDTNWSSNVYKARSHCSSSVKLGFTVLACGPGDCIKKGL